MPQSRNGFTGTGEHTRPACAGGRLVRQKDRQCEHILRFAPLTRVSVRREARRTAPGAGALPYSARRCLQKAAEDCRTPRRFAFVRAPDSCASFWTAPVLWRFRPTETASPRTMFEAHQRLMMRPLTKAEAQPRQGRHHCRIQWKQFPSSVRSGIVRRHNPIAVTSNLRLSTKGKEVPPLTGL